MLFDRFLSSKVSLEHPKDHPQRDKMKLGSILDLNSCQFTPAWTLMDRKLPIKLWTCVERKLDECHSNLSISAPLFAPLRYHIRPVSKDLESDRASSMTFNDERILLLDGTTYLFPYLGNSCNTVLNDYYWLTHYADYFYYIILALVLLY